MWAALVLLALSIAAPALAQEGGGALDVQTINGARVWRPTPAPARVARQTAPAPTTLVVVNNLPAAEPWPGAIVGLPICTPLLNRPVRTPTSPHPGVRSPRFQPRVDVPSLPGRRFCSEWERGCAYIRVTPLSRRVRTARKTDPSLAVIYTTRIPSSCPTATGCPGLPACAP
jgi:hypothetical protein